MHQGIKIHFKNGLVVLLLQQVADALKAKHPGALEQYGLVVKMVGVKRSQKIFDGVVKSRRKVEGCFVFRNIIANAKQAAHAFGFYQAGHLGIQSCRRNTGLQDIGKDQGFLWMSGLGVQKIQGNGQGVQVIIIAVVDHQAVVNALLHFHAHGHGLQLGHLFPDPAVAVIHLTKKSHAMQGIFHRGMIGERYLKIKALSQVVYPDLGVSSASLKRNHLQVSSSLCRPRKQLNIGVKGLPFPDIMIQFGMVSAIDQGICIDKQLQLLANFYFPFGEAFIVGRTNIGKNAYLGFNDPLKLFHFTRLRDTSLKNPELMLALYLPYRQRHAHLGVVAARVAHHRHFLRKELKKPFLDNSFAVAAGNTHHRQAEHYTVGRSQSLQCRQGVANLYKGRFFKHLRMVIGQLRHHKATHTPFKQGFDVTVPIVFGGNNGQKHGACRRYQPPAVGEQMPDGHTGQRCAKQLPPCHIANVRKLVCRHGRNFQKD